MLQPKEMTACDARAALRAGSLTSQALNGACLALIADRHPANCAWSWIGAVQPALPRCVATPLRSASENACAIILGKTEHHRFRRRRKRRRLP